jgi:hypothetical protein
MLLTVTVRRLKPGTYDAFRAAVVPDPWPPILKSIQVLRSQEDPDEVCTLGMLDVSPEELEALRDQPEFLLAEAARLERVSAFADTVVVNEVFELAEELSPPGA